VSVPRPSSVVKYELRVLSELGLGGRGCPLTALEREAWC
jgi:hypothetical protein